MAAMKRKRRSEEKAGVAGFLLFPGASGDVEHSTFLAMQAALHPLPVRVVGFRDPATGKRLGVRAERLLPFVMRTAAAFAVELGCTLDRVVIGGRSLGGRVCSMAATDAGCAVAGCVCVSYPLHPPGKPHCLRTAHLADLKVPSLFVSGTRDEFGSRAELEAALGLVSRPPTVVFLEGGRHSLTGKDDDVVAAVVAFVKGLMVA